MSKGNGERRRTRVSSSVDKLPDDIRAQLDAKLADTSNTYVELSVWLDNEGYKISKSAIGRYAIRTTHAAQRLAETLQRTRVIAKAVEEHPDLDFTKAGEILMVDGLMRRISTAEDEFEEMPLEKAGQLMATFSRNATYEKRVRQEMKKKMELAFDQMELDLLAKVKQHPDLSAELRDLLVRTREKVLADVTD